MHPKSETGEIGTLFIKWEIVNYEEAVHAPLPISSREFKIKAVARTEGGENISALRELKVRRSMLNRWRDTFRQFGEAGFRGRGRPARQDTEPTSCVT